MESKKSATRLISKLACLLLFALLSLNLNAQIKIKKPTIEINKPTIGGNSGSSSSSSPTVVPGKDPSGLFSQVSDDPSAEHHRKAAVENLGKLEAEYAKTTVDYEMLTKLMFENERTLGHIKKLEPNAKSDKYYEKYTPLKERADKENVIYAQVQKLEKVFENDFRAQTEFKTPDVLSYRSDSYGVRKDCYCRAPYTGQDKSHADYLTNKAEYDKLSAQLVGYSDENTKKGFTNMETCIANGNKYATWAAKEGVQKDVVDYSAKNKIAEPKDVIKRCGDYLAALGRIEADHSLSLDASAKMALTEGKATIAKVKAENELYISSGEYQKYLDKMHAEKIAKVFLPKAVTVNAKLEEGAKAYIKGAEYADYLKNSLSESAVASTVRAVTVSKDYYVKKNDIGIPEYQYHEIWVAYKGVDGKCYMAAVYASYTYKGGGTYSTVPTWSADRPEEMACVNVSK